MTTQPPSVTVEYTVLHPTGRVEEEATASTFGPTTDLHFAQKRLRIADSDCLCSDGTEPHALVTRTVTVSEWTSQNAPDEAQS